MFRVIIDRPRSQGDGGKSIPAKGYKKRIQREFEDLPKRESMMRPYGYNTKELNEHLGPLWRYLNSQVGRPWNKVFSEICEQISQNSATQSHVRDHVLMYVQRSVIMKGKRPFKVAGYGFDRKDDGLVGIYDDFYVNPRTGLLCKSPDRKRHRGRRDEQKFVQHPTNKLIQYHNFAGIWYELSLAAYVVGGWDCVINTFVSECDVIMRRWQPGQLAKLYGRQNVYCYKKRQLNSREIKRLKLG